MTGSAFTLGLQKYVRKHEGAVTFCMMVLKIRITCKQKCD